MVQVPTWRSSHSPLLTAGGNDDSDFRELHTAREFSEDDEEETTSQDWGTPRELTFSYIAFDGAVGAGARRDSAARRPRPQGRSVSEPREPPLQPGLGDSLESIPSLSQSPEPGRRGDPDTAPLAERPLDDLGFQLGWAAREARYEEDSATSSSTPLEDEEEAGEARKGETSEVLGPKPQRVGGLFSRHLQGESSRPSLSYARTGPTTQTHSVLASRSLDSTAQSW